MRVSQESARVCTGGGRAALRTLFSLLCARCGVCGASPRPRSDMRSDVRQHSASLDWSTCATVHVR